MRCKKHPADFSSTAGVCATCLRERLLAVMEAQAQAQLRQPQVGHDRKSDTHLSFPRSVSPYISRRKSDTGATQQMHSHGRFYSTPHVGPTGSGSLTVEINRDRRSSGGRLFSMFMGLFRSRSEKFESGVGRVRDPVQSGPVASHAIDSRDPCPSSSPSFFSAILPNRRKKQNRNFSNRRILRNDERGLSPARFSDDEEDEHFPGGSSGYSSESSQGWRQTPRRTPAVNRNSGGRAMLGRNVSGLKFCLSPLVRASPNRHRNLPEMMIGGEVRAPAKPSLSAATSFCKNRSRKLADFGRYNPNY